MICVTPESKSSMDLPWTGNFPVFIIAHRGFSGAAPENTLASFQKAIEAGSDMIELDTCLSKDGELVVIHDDTLDRTTNRKGKVSDFTLDELKQLDAGSWYGPPFAGERIPTLKEVLDLARGRIPVNIELKVGGLGRYTLKELADRALQEVEKAGMEKQVLFCSFSPQALERIKERNPGIPTALVWGKKWDFPQEITGGKSFPILVCRDKFLTKGNLSRARQKGMKVWVWTVDEAQGMEEFLNLGVDGIITNYPDRLVQILRKKKP